METIKDKALALIKDASSLEILETIRVTYLSKKGEVQALMRQMGTIDASERPSFGKKVNEIKDTIEAALNEKKATLETIAQSKQLEASRIDVTLPGVHFEVGRKNPLLLMRAEIETLFREMGYSITEGEDVETDEYNFERANIPADHPAREMQDTFYIDAHRLLRTHTTAVQTRTLEAHAPHVPVKVICPGKTYRRDEDDATHSHQFMQIEGLVVGHGVTLADLKGTLSFFAKRVFGPDRNIRFRPSYFQFTEPSVEVDVSCHVCDGKGCSVCKQTGWIEILGAGMVHPEVLKMAGYTDTTLTGFAFGVGVERMAMLKYGIKDIRDFYQNDVRFIEQFKRFE